ncbi:hypothetical protein Droror1_Dr00019183 [Drosera rotundifolia]
MKPFTYFLLLLFCSCLLVSPNGIDASNQARSLLRSIKTRRSGNPNYKDPLTAVDIRREDVLIDIYGEKCSKETDKIDALPGQPEGVNFNQYGGYVTVDKTAQKALYYYFVESPENPETKPLVLWLNGGPGCSSIGNGAFEEQGPFRVNGDGKTLFLNPYAWNKVANVIFLESPAGVGFSYGNDTTAVLNDTGDKSTARDAYKFLVKWLHRFPEYKSRDFYVTGESYGGHYVPQLAYTILHHNSKGHARTKINLKGIMFGNGLINDPTDTRGFCDYLWTHALISDESHNQLIGSGCDFFDRFSVYRTLSSECWNLFVNVLNGLGNINDYSIYSPICLNSALANSSIPGSVDNFDPCSDYYVNAYLNNPEVQAALHARPTSWSTCNNFNWTDQAYTVLPNIQALMAHNMRVWIYSGDVDSVVPVTSTKYTIESLKLPIKTNWYPWYLNQQVGGYVVEYENLTFATVRDAGHEVPSYQPERALALFSSYLDGTLPPSS